MEAIQGRLDESGPGEAWWVAVPVYTVVGEVED